MTRDVLHVPRARLDEAVRAGLLDGAQADGLWRFLSEGTEAKPRFDMVHLLWYLGALIVIAAMGLFTTEAWQRFGPGSLIVIALSYAAAFSAGAEALWRRGLRVPGGLLASVAVTMAPLAVFAVQQWLGTDQPGYREFYRLIKSEWVPMEIVTVLAGAAALTRFRFGFVLMPVSVALWFLSMDVVLMLTPVDSLGDDTRKVVSLAFGIAMMLAAWAVDVAARKDFAYWLHLFGLLAGWGGLTAMNSDSEVGKALYCAINVGLLFAAIFLQRRAYAVFGGLGITLYLGHLAGVVFKDSLTFSFALSAIGVAIIAGGLAFHKRQARIEAWLESALPASLARLRPAHARI